MTETQESISAYQIAIRCDPVRWAKEALGVELYGPQKDVMESVMDSEYWRSQKENNPKKANMIKGRITKTAWRTGHAVGKSFLASVIALARVQAYAPGYVITTGSSWAGVEKILWSEIRSMIRKAPVDLFPGITPMQTELRLGPGWGIFGVSTNEVENFAGYHEQNGPLVIIDEASALAYDIYESILGVCSTANSAVLAIGNPISPDGPFRDMFDDPEYKCFHSSSEDTPNVKGGQPAIPGLCEQEYIDSMAATYGRKSAVFQSRVLGEFPKSAEDSLISMDMVEDAQERFDTLLDEGIDPDELRLGVDVARFGGDRTVLLIRDNKSILHLEWFVGQDLMQTCGHVRNIVDEWGIDSAQIYVDDTGVGGGVVDRLREMDYDAQPVNNAERPVDEERFINTRTETYWMMRDALEEGFALPRGEDFDTLAKELTVARYKLNSTGKLQLEAKKEIKKRLERSPDLADALALTFVPGSALMEYL